MSLLYDADGDIWQATSNVSVPTAGTAVTWFYPTSDAFRQSVCLYDGDGLGTSYMQIAFRGDLAGDYFYFERERSTTRILLQSDAANFSAYGLNKWLCLVARWDASGVDADQSFLMGDETTAPAAPSSYTTQSVGSGTPGTTAGVAVVGGSNVNTTRWLRGRVGFHALFPSRLSDADVTEVWRGRYQNNPSIWWLPGANGTTDVPDVASGNTGVITGLSSPDSEPRRMFPPPWYAYAQMRS